MAKISMFFCVAFPKFILMLLKSLNSFKIIWTFMFLAKNSPSSHIQTQRQKLYHPWALEQTARISSHPNLRSSSGCTAIPRASLRYMQRIYSLTNKKMLIMEHWKNLIVFWMWLLFGTISQVARNLLSSLHMRIS